MASSSFDKRIRRHVTGRVREYFAATAPGLEKICKAELDALPLSLHDTIAAAGGVAFRGRLSDCCLANLHLRTATRILMAAGEFRASARSV